MSDQKEKQEAIEEIKMKRCSRKTCLKEYPATSEFFKANNNSADKLSYYCKPCQAQIAKDKYYNKKSTVRDLKPKEIETQTSPIETPPLSEDKTKKIQYQVCSICKKSIKLTKDNFWRNKRNLTTGFETACRECSKQQKKDRRKLKKAAAAGNVPKHSILLRFDDTPELFARVQDWARKNRRNPDQQIIFALEQEILKVG